MFYVMYAGRRTLAPQILPGDYLDYHLFASVLLMDKTRVQNMFEISVLYPCNSNISNIFLLQVCETLRVALAHGEC